MERILAELLRRLLSGPVQVGLALSWLLLAVAAVALRPGSPEAPWCKELPVVLLVWILGSGILEQDRKRGTLALFWVRPRPRWQYVAANGLALWLGVVAVLAVTALLELIVRSGFLEESYSTSRIVGSWVHASLGAFPHCGVVLGFSALLPRGADFAVWFLGLNLTDLANRWSVTRELLLPARLVFEFRRWLLPWAEPGELWRSSAAILVAGSHLLAVTLATLWLACWVVGQREVPIRGE